MLLYLHVHDNGADCMQCCVVHDNRRCVCVCVNPHLCKKRDMTRRVVVVRVCGHGWMDGAFLFSTRQCVNVCMCCMLLTAPRKGRGERGEEDKDGCPDIGERA
ncbi:hypothetical protein B0O80DRAFT_453150 [Mortierella sp. GBAus27b]|nr:hypothetical protein B0O80DRAFT_453150 [Mortierella sp. GBAus27b]